MSLHHEDKFQPDTLGHAGADFEGQAGAEEEMAMDTALELGHA